MSDQVGKKAKVETPKSLQKSGKKGVKEPKTSAVEESFAGFEEDEINLNSEGRINLNNVIDKLGGDKVASTSQAVVDETPAEEAEDKQTAEEEDQEMTVDTAAAVSDDTDSDQMEIDSRASDKGDKNKEAEDVDIMDTDSVKSDNAKTDSAVEKGATAKIEYCGACSAQVDDAEEGICCDGACERWFHLKCSGLSNAEYYQLSSDENAAWACSKCSGKPPPILPADSKTPKISVRKDLQKTPGPSVAKRKSVAREGATPRTPKIDVSNPAYLKPFDFGWKRELVYRTSNENASGKRNGDVYYYAPQGKKLRSLREISEHVSGTELTADNFTFFKEPLGIDDPEKEIIRDAKYKLAKDGTASPSIVAKKAAAATPKISKAPPKTTPKLTATVKSAVDTNGTTDTPKAHGSVAARGVLKGKNTPMPTLKVKIAPLKTVTPRPIISKEKRKKVVNDGEMEIGMLPPMWDPTPKKEKTPTGSAKRVLEAAEDSPAAKRLKPDSGPPLFMKNLMQNLSYMQASLLHAFQYLKVQELLRASRVNHLWHDLALHRSLWETVRMKNSQVKDWEGFATTLRRTRTKHLDLRKILVPGGKDDTDAAKTMWTECVKALPKVDSLVKIDFCRCTSSLVQQIAQACPQLECILAVFIKDVEFDFIDLKNCANLTELKLKSQSGIEIKNIDTLKSLKQLKTLSLLTIKNLNEVLKQIGELTQLETLELGEMTNIDKDVVVQALTPLTKLKRLRLEKGQNESPTVDILKKISELPSLNQLELINFDIKVGFDNALALCSNIKTLLIIPTYVTQSATTNHLVIEGVSRLSKTLNHFVWGLTLELLRVTDLFIDQWEQNQGPKNPSAAPKKTGNHDSIPILKPVSKDSKPKEGAAVTQVDVLQLPKLHKVLTTVLPNTKIIILKVPFTATWRQTINSSPN